jgi:hypothetical protein
MIKKVGWMWQSNKGNLLERVQFKVLDKEILNTLWEEKCHGIKTTIEFYFLYDVNMIIKLLLGW